MYFLNYHIFCDIKLTTIISFKSYLGKFITLFWILNFKSFISFSFIFNWFFNNSFSSFNFFISLLLIWLFWISDIILLAFNKSDFNFSFSFFNFLFSSSNLLFFSISSFNFFSSSFSLLSTLCSSFNSLFNCSLLLFSFI